MDANGNPVWSQLDSVEGAAEKDNFGYSVAISADGRMVVTLASSSNRSNV